MSVNKVILVGYVGKDPEVRYFEKDVAVANFTLATTDRAYTTQNGTLIPERTEWHNLVARRSFAELAEKYIRKGTQLYVEGKIQTRSWEKDGIKRYVTEIHIEAIDLIGKKPEHIEPIARITVPAAQVSSSTVNSTVAEPIMAMATPPHGEEDLPF
jgi:single-strand DNA-binding protein